MHVTINPLSKSAGSTNLSSLGLGVTVERSGYDVGGSTHNLNVPASVGAAGTGMQSSKSSSHLLVDSIPNVFCLSCPPAEFKFSDAYRAKTLPRSGKEVSQSEILHYHWTGDLIFGAFCFCFDSCFIKMQI